MAGNNNLSMLTIDDRIREIDAHCRRREYEEALALAEDFIDRFPDDPAGEIQKGLIFQRRQQWEAAAVHWAAVRRKYPQHLDGYVHGVTSHRHQREYGAALALAEALIASFPDDPAGEIQKGLVFQHSQRWEAAIAHWETVRRKYPELFDGYLYGLVSCLANTEYGRALVLAREACRLFPDISAGPVQLGMIYMQCRDWSQALEQWRLCRARFARHLAGYTQAVIAHCQNLEYLKAVEVAESAIKLFPGRPDGPAMLAGVYMHRRQWREAARLWRSIRKKYPDHLPGYVRGLAALRAAGDLDQAETLAAETLRLFPDEPDGHVQQAELFMNRGDHQGAARYWAFIRQRFPGHPAAYDRGVAALLKQGEDRLAARLAVQSILLMPARGLGYQILAEAHHVREIL